MHTKLLLKKGFRRLQSRLHILLDPHQHILVEYFVQAICFASNKVYLKTNTRASTIYGVFGVGAFTVGSVNLNTPTPKNVPRRFAIAQAANTITSPTKAAVI